MNIEMVASHSDIKEALNALISWTDLKLQNTDSQGDTQFHIHLYPTFFFFYLFFPPSCNLPHFLPSFHFSSHPFLYYPAFSLFHSFFISVLSHLPMFLFPHLFLYFYRGVVVIFLFISMYLFIPIYNILF